MQMLSLFSNEDSYPVSTPPAYAKYIQDASVWANVDFYSFFNVGCISYTSYLDATMVQILVPTVLIVLAMVGAFVFFRRGDNAKTGLCLQFMIVFTFLIFVSTTNAIFGMLNCRVLADGKYHLVADLDVICYEGEHAPYQFAAFVFIIFYPIGVPTFLLLSLQYSRGDLFEDDPDHPGQKRATAEPKKLITKHVATMYKKYEPWVGEQCCVGRVSDIHPCVFHLRVALCIRSCLATLAVEAARGGDTLPSPSPLLPLPCPDVLV